MIAKQNMALAIDVTVCGAASAKGELSAVAKYVMVSSDPECRAEVVDACGNIDLRKLDPGTGYNNAIDITFNLRGTVGIAGGERRNVMFQSPPSAAVTIEKLEGEGSARSFVPAFSADADPRRLIITDANDDQSTYKYCLNIETQCEQKMKGCLDPAITNR